MKLITLNFLKLAFVFYLSSVLSIRTFKESSLLVQVPTAPPISNNLINQLIGNNIPVSTNKTNTTSPNVTNITVPTNITNTTSPNSTNTSSNNSDAYYVPYFQNKTDNVTEFEPVSIVKELSPAGKKELEIRESGE